MVFEEYYTIFRIFLSMMMKPAYFSIGIVDSAVSRSRIQRSKV